MEEADASDAQFYGGSPPGSSQEQVNGIALGVGWPTQVEPAASTASTPMDFTPIEAGT